MSEVRRNIFSQLSRLKIFITVKLLVRSLRHEDVWGGVDVWIHVFLASALVGGEWSA
jgi:hypothetical protein